MTEIGTIVEVRGTGFQPVMTETQWQDAAATGIQRFDGVLPIAGKLQELSLLINPLPRKTTDWERG